MRSVVLGQVNAAVGDASSPDAITSSAAQARTVRTLADPPGARRGARDAQAADGAGRPISAKASRDALRCAGPR